MTDINRMAMPLCPQGPDEIDLTDQEFRECPYPGFELLREQAPVWHDPRTGAYVVSRYDDMRAILMDPKTYSSVRPREADIVNQARNERLMQAYQRRGWVPAPTLALRDEPEHGQMRGVYETAFRAAKIKALEPFVEATAQQLIDGFIDEGQCEFARAFALELPLIVTCKQMGVPIEDRWTIKGWTDAWTTRTGSMATTDAIFDWCVDKEIEAQHYFQPIFERLRRQPDESLLSDLVNRVIPEWGRPLNDNELHAAMMSDTFVGGSETTAHSLTAGMMLADQNPGTWEKLKSDPGKYLRGFIEEVLRLESPVQSRVRVTTRAVELHGVSIPAGAVVDLRYGAANRDWRHFADPEKFDLARDNVGSHLAFASGTHHCLGAPLARRELFIGFAALLARIKSFRLTPGKNDLRHIPHFFLRGMKELHIEFVAEPAA